MRYVVLGCAAIGRTVAAALARDGHDVLVADTDPEVVRHSNAAGLRIEGPVEEFTAHPRAVLPAGPARSKSSGPGIAARNTRMLSVAAAHPGLSLRGAGNNRAVSTATASSLLNIAGRGRVSA